MSNKIFNILFIIGFAYFLIWNSQEHKSELLKKEAQEEILKRENKKLENFITKLQTEAKLTTTSLIAIKNENIALKNESSQLNEELTEIKGRVHKEKENYSVDLAKLKENHLLELSKLKESHLLDLSKIKESQKEIQNQADILLNNQIIINQDLSLKNSELIKENLFLNQELSKIKVELSNKSLIKNVIIEEKLKPLLDKSLEIKTSEKVNPIQPYKPSFWTRLKKYIKRKLFPKKQLIINQKKYSDIEAKQIYEKNIIQAKKDFIPSKIINFYLLCKENKITNTQLSETEDADYWIKDLIFLDPSGTIIVNLKINKKTPPQLESGYQFNAEVSYNDLHVISFTGHLDLKKDPQWFDIDVLSYIPGLWINGINQNLNNEF